MALLTTLATALSGKAAAALAGATLVGGGLAIAADDAQPSDDRVPTTESPDVPRDEAVDTDLVVDEVDTDETDPETEDVGSEGRSTAVHDALTDGQAQPGDPDFGATVSENARGANEDGEAGRDFGQNVAETARDGAGEESSAEGRARADEAREGAGEQAEPQAENRSRAEAGPGTGEQQREQGRQRAVETPAGDAAQSNDRPGGPGSGNGNGNRP